MSNFLGEDAKLYVIDDVIVVDDPIDYETLLATASECTVVGSLTDNFQHDNPQYRTRGNAWVINGVSKTDATVSFEMKWTPGDAAFDIIVDAWALKSEFAAWILDQAYDVSGAQGAVGNWVITQFNKNETTGEFQTVSVEMKPSSLNDWITLA